MGGDWKFLAMATGASCEYACTNKCPVLDRNITDEMWSTI